MGCEWMVGVSNVNKGIRPFCIMETIRTMALRLAQD